MPAVWATRLIFAAPSFVTTAEASWLFDHRIIGAEDLPLVASQVARAHVRLAQVGDEQQRLDDARALHRAVEVAAPDVLLRPHRERHRRPAGASA